MGQGRRGFGIGGLSARTGCNVETIRYYERIGLLPAPPRSAGGHRLYGPDDAGRLGFTRRSRELGFSLGEIRALLELANGADYDCGRVREITLHRLQDVTERIRDLRRLERTLRTISSACEGGIAPNCPIIEALYSGRPDP